MKLSRRKAFIKIGTFFVVSFLLSFTSSGQFASFNDQAFMVQSQSSTFPFSHDEMSSYTDTAAFNGLNGGVTGTIDPWAGPYVDNSNFIGLQLYDMLSTYSDASPLQGLNGGSGWSGFYVDATNYLRLLASDDMSAYTDGQLVDGLTGGGTGWGGAYVDN